MYFKISIQSNFVSSRNILFLLSHPYLQSFLVKDFILLQENFLKMFPDSIPFNNDTMINFNNQFLDFAKSQKLQKIDNSVQTEFINSTEQKSPIYKIIFSNDLKKDSNFKYELDLFLKNISFIKINSFKIKFNLYNISSSNNTFAFSENNIKTQIKLPIGHYTYKQLLSEFVDKLNKSSKHNFKYSFNLNTIKNKTSIVCKDSNNHNQNFNLYFINKLNTQLGFLQMEYLNNYSYINEIEPFINIYDNIYIKIYINNEPLNLYKTSSNNSFTFYINTNENDFNKFIHTKFDKIQYHYKSKINIVKFGIEFYDSNFNEIDFHNYHFYLDLQFN
jgi:hypothetical protein